MNDGGIECRCNAFTNEKTEFVPAYEVIESRHINNSQNLYNAYIDIAAENGADKTAMQNCMDYQTMTDFLISNTDEHLLNFGLLRDTNSMRVIGPAPIFDSGNSMFYADERLRPYTRVELLQREITVFYKTEEKMLANVKNPHILRLDLLPSAEIIKEFYAKAGVPESRLEIISHGYQDKISFIDEMQHGIKISLYQEKQKEKNIKIPAAEHNAKTLPKQFIMAAGIPGSGKRTYVNSILQKIQKEGYQLINAEMLYPAEKADQSSMWFVDRNSIVSSIRPDGKNHQNEVVYVNPNDIRNERAQKGLPENDDLVFAAVYARIKQAALNGQTVIYSATNLDKKQRESVLETYGRNADSYKLAILYADPDKIQTDIPKETMEKMTERLHASAPDKSEGWNEIENIGDDPLIEEKKQNSLDDDYEL